jgi:hypothetical protein
MSGFHFHIFQWLLNDMISTKRCGSQEEPKASGGIRSTPDLKTQKLKDVLGIG